MKRQVDELFDRAIDLDPELRAQFVFDEAGENGELRARVLAMLAAAERASPLDRPLASAAGDLVSAVEDARLGRGDLEGEVLGTYRVGNLRAEGGMSDVYEAHRIDGAFDRRVAVKVLRRGFGHAADVDRLKREGQILAGLSNRHVASILDGGLTRDRRPYVILEWIEGRPLPEHCRFFGLGLQDRIRLVGQVCEGVRHAHRHGVLHRDIKPSNLLVERNEAGGDRVVVCDFGIARPVNDSGLTLTGQTLGTPGYMSPEQARGETGDLSVRSDIFSLGAVIYELVCGRPLYAGHSTGEILSRALAGEFERPRRIEPAISRDLETVLLVALDPLPEKRYASVAQLAEDLESLLAGEPISVRRPTLGERAWRRAKQEPRLSVAAGVALLVIAGALGVALRSRWHAVEQAALADRFGQQAERMDHSLRLSYMLPLHDVREDRVRAERELDTLAREVEAAGKPGAGPGNLALGRGFLRLGRLDDARRHLELSWASGYRTPAVAVALGQALGRLFSESVRASERLAEPELRREERARATRALAVPARAYLAEALASGPALSSHERSWLEGMLALVEGETGLAATLGRRAASERAWFYEGEMLAGEADLQRAATARLETRFEEAEAALVAAEESLERARAMAPSDPAAHLAVCRVGGQRLALLAEHGGSLDGELVAVREDCQFALLADPDFSAALELESYATTLVAETWLGQGRDLEPLLASAESDARRALAANDSSAFGYQQLARSEWLRARRAFDVGQDPRPGALRAVAHFRTALERAPGDGVLQLELGRTLVRMGQWATFRGSDPLPDWRAAVHLFATAGETQPVLASRLAAERCSVLTELGYFQFQRGSNPRDDLPEAVAACEEAVELAPQYLRARHLLGYALWSLAEVRAARREGPETAFERAQQAFSKVLGTDPASSATQVNLAHVLAEHAAWILERGGDPAALLAEAEEHTRAFREIYPADFALIQGKVELVRARAGSAASWAVAEAHARAYTEVEPEQVVGFAFLAEVYRRRVEDPREMSRSERAEALNSGLSASRRALELDPGESEVMAHRAVLLHLGAASRTGDREAWLAEAAQLAAAAVAKRPDLAADLAVVRYPLAS